MELQRPGDLEGVQVWKRRGLETRRFGGFEGYGGEVWRSGGVASSGDVVSSGGGRKLRK